MYTVEVLRALGCMDNLRTFLICSPEFEWQSIKGVHSLPVLQGLGHPWSVLRRAKFLTAQWRNPTKLIRAAEQEHIQVIHLQSYHHLSFGQWKESAKRSGVKWVISAHDVKRDVAILHKGWEDERLKASYRFADAILVHSSYQKEELIDFAQVAASKIHLVPHGPYEYAVPSDSREAIRSSLRIPEQSDVALFFGQIRNDKNLESFLEALASAQTGTHLLVAGQPGGRHQAADYYRKLTEELGIGDRVHFFFGHIPAEEVGIYFKAADWVVLPYKESFTSQSGVLNIAAQFDRLRPANRGSRDFDLVTHVRQLGADIVGISALHIQHTFVGKRTWRINGGLRVHAEIGQV